MNCRIRKEEPEWAWRPHWLGDNSKDEVVLLLGIFREEFRKKGAMRKNNSKNLHRSPLDSLLSKKSVIFRVKKGQRRSKSYNQNNSQNSYKLMKHSVSKSNSTDLVIIWGIHWKLWRDHSYHELDNSSSKACSVTALEKLKIRSLRNQTDPQTI